MADIGDNSGALRSFIERIEEMEAEKKLLCEDIKSIYAEAKSDGYDKNVVRMVVARRRKDPDKLREEEQLLETYLSALE